MSKSYERRGEWSSYTVRTARTGWIVETSSAIQGEWTDVKILVPYNIASYADRHTDLASALNDVVRIGDYVHHLAMTDSRVRYLRRGRRVM